MTRSLASSSWTILIPKATRFGKPSSGTGLFDRFAAAYLRGVSWEPRVSIESRIARLLPALFLARIDGKSPIEYVTSEHDKNRVRDTARPLIRCPANKLHDIRRTWAKEVA